MATSLSSTMGKLGPFIVAFVLTAANCPLWAQASSADVPGQVVQIDAGQLRTPADMAASAATLAPSRKQMAPNHLPTMDPALYQQLKADMDVTYAPSIRGQRAAAPGPLFPPSDTGNGWDGTNQTSTSFYPSDSNAAPGAGQVVAVTNDQVVVYDQSGNSLLTTSLGGLMGTTEQIFDPRARYDPVWGRFLVTSSRQAASATDSDTHMWLAISQSSDATGPFIVYRLPLFESAGNWCDYDQLGYDQDAVLITCNIFHRPVTGQDQFQHGWIMTLPKAEIYNARGAIVQTFVPPAGNITPPVVSLDPTSDANAITYFLSAPPSGTALTELKLTNSSRAFAAALTMSTVPVTAYTFPPPAHQPGTAATLDTLDARFENAIQQVGFGPTSLFAAHSINFGGAANKFYEVNGEAGTLIQSGVWFDTPTSADFDVSIAADPNHNVFVTWTNSDDGPAQTLPDMEISGRCRVDAPGAIFAPGAAVGTSQSFYNLFRWGDYSSVVYNPEDGTAWANSQTIIDPNTWNTHIHQIAFSPPCP